MKRSFFVIVAAGVTLAALPIAARAADGVKVAAVIKGLDNPFFQYMRQGIDDAAKTQHASVTIQAAAGMSDATGQADRLSAMAMQDFGCYLVNPISVSNLVQALVPVAQKKVPIVNIDNPVDTNQAKAAGFAVGTYIGTDNVAAGALAGRELARLLPKGSKVALIQGIPGDASNETRAKGFKQAIEGQLDLVDSIAADWDREKALTAADTILRAHPDLKGFFAANDVMALGVERAVQGAGKGDDVKVVGLDGITDALKSVAAGQLSATVSQYPFVVGAMGLEACVAAAAGKTLPAKVDAPVQLITKDNAAAALKNFPQPADPYPDPFRDLVQK